MGNFHGEKSTEKGAYGYTKFAACLMQGWRHSMQDFHISIAPFSEKKLGLFGILDGHQGPFSAIFVKRRFPIQLMKSNKFMSQDYEAALRQTFLKMDEIWFSPEGIEQGKKISNQLSNSTNLHSQEQLQESGCQANIILVTPGYIYCASVGQCQSIAEINNKTTLLSINQTIEDPDENRRIVRAGGEILFGRINGGLNIPRVLGTLSYKSNKMLSNEQQMAIATPVITKTPNENIRFIIMGSDGMWGVKSCEEIRQWVSLKLDQKKENEKIIEELFDEIVDRNDPKENCSDNLCCILIEFSILEESKVVLAHMILSKIEECDEELLQTSIDLLDEEKI